MPIQAVPHEAAINGHLQALRSLLLERGAFPRIVICQDVKRSDLLHLVTIPGNMPRADIARILREAINCLDRNDGGPTSHIIVPGGGQAAALLSKK